MLQCIMHMIVLCFKAYHMSYPKSLLLIISGSVAAYKALELIRLLRAQGTTVHTILTKSGAKFVTPLAVSALTGTKTYDDLFSLTDEVEMGHIELSRMADFVLVAPASADILAKMAAGIADDLATTALLATNKPVIIAPAMNHKMWSHPATQRNVAQLRADGIRIIEPTEGDMACGEFGVGRLAEPEAILSLINRHFREGGNPSFSSAHATKEIPAFAGMTKSLLGTHAIVTSGPTAEPIDPVRYLANRSSGKQGHAIATALAARGARVTLISGPVQLADPHGVSIIRVHTAEDMLKAVERALPADIFIAAAAVADWRATHISTQKIKKHTTRSKLTLELVPTEDILARVVKHKKRPRLVVGFAAETENLSETARAKRRAKGADWLLANSVKNGAVFGAEENSVLFVDSTGEQQWPRMRKDKVAEKLAQLITEYFTTPTLKKGKAS